MTKTAKIYTKSGCGYCDRAKELLEDYGFEYEELCISEYKYIYLGSATAQATSPQIFIGGVHVGGHDDLKAGLEAGKWLNNEAS